MVLMEFLLLFTNAVGLTRSSYVTSSDIKQHGLIGLFYIQTSISPFHSLQHACITFFSNTNQKQVDF